MTIPTWFLTLIAFLFGINIGSFLNVVIWRLPTGGSLIEPKYSYCPRCKRRLTAIDLVPVISFLALGRRCRTCKQPISWRYFCVELLTGLLYVALTLHFAHTIPDAVALLLFATLLVPITFTDLDHFLIPSALNLLAFAVAIGRDGWGIATHEAGHELLWGWMPRSILGALVGIAIFGAVRIAGWIWKRVEAMGLGDVLLARAMGAMLVSIVPAGQPALRLFPVWVLLSCLSGLVVGPLLIFLRTRQAAGEKSAGGAPISQGNSTGDVESEQAGMPDDTSTFGQQVMDIGYCVWMGDLIEYVQDKFRGNRTGDPEQAAEEEDDWEPAPSAIPFGPFLAIGFLATVFVGDQLTRWYLAFALPKP